MSGNHMTPAEQQYSDLEEPLRELFHIAAIARELVFNALDNPSVKRQGAAVVATMLQDEHERLLFAMSKASRMAEELDRKYHAQWTESTTPNGRRGHERRREVRPIRWRNISRANPGRRRRLGGHGCDGPAPIGFIQSPRAARGGFGRPFCLLKRFAVVDIVNALYHCDTTGAL
jgi:hypothetical protein